jgi:hypothetical protein
VVGYLSKEDVEEAQQSATPFDELISGILWLVRNGTEFVESSKFEEDAGAQETGDVNTFINVRSARTAVGHFKDGRLGIVQVEGRTWNRGINLHEFAQFLIGLGFWNAINLDGGGSSSMSINGTLISAPSWECDHDNDLDGKYLRCEKPVSTITCIHAMSPLSATAFDQVRIIGLSCFPFLSPST